MICAASMRMSLRSSKTLSRRPSTSWTQSTSLWDASGRTPPAGRNAYATMSCSLLATARLAVGFPMTVFLTCLRSSSVRTFGSI